MTTPHLMSSTGRATKVMLLIDADNVTADVIEQAVPLVIERHGAAHVRRAYCTAELALKQLKLFKAHSIRPIVNISTGKNSTDIALAVDAMDLADRERPDVVVIVSSDSDFAPLVIRLREKGCRVEGIGQEGKTGEDSKPVYDDFTDLTHRKARPATGRAGGGRGAGPRAAARSAGGTPPSRGAGLGGGSARGPGRGERGPSPGQPMADVRAGAGAVADLPWAAMPESPPVVDAPAPAKAPVARKRTARATAAAVMAEAVQASERGAGVAGLVGSVGSAGSEAADRPTGVAEGGGAAPTSAAAPTAAAAKAPRGARAATKRASAKTAAVRADGADSAASSAGDATVDALAPAPQPAGPPAEASARVARATRATRATRAARRDASDAPSLPDAADSADAAGGAEPPRPTSSPARRRPARGAARPAADAMPEPTPADAAPKPTPVATASRDRAPGAARAPSSAPASSSAPAPASASASASSSAPAPTPTPTPAPAPRPRPARLPDEVARILAALPELRSGTRMQLNLAKERLFNAGLLARSAPSTKLFRKHPTLFALLPPDAPNKVQFLAPDAG